MRTVKGMRLLLAAFSLGAALAWSGDGLAQECRSWQQLRPYLQKFFEVEGKHRDNLIGNFNALQPRTDFKPDIIGYAWFSGERMVKLYMVVDGCVVLDRYYPRQAIWRLMAGNVAQMDFDKSAKRYEKVMQDRHAAQDKAWQDGQKFQQKMFEENQSQSDDEPPLHQDIN